MCGYEHFQFGPKRVNATKIRRKSSGEKRFLRPDSWVGCSRDSPIAIAIVWEISIAYFMSLVG